MVSTGVETSMEAGVEMGAFPLRVTSNVSDISRASDGETSLLDFTKMQEVCMLGEHGFDNTLESSFGCPW